MKSIKTLVTQMIKKEENIIKIAESMDGRPE